MVNKTRSVVRLDDSRFVDGDIFSVRIDKEMENGFVGKLGEVEKGNADVRALETPAAEDSLVIIANDPLVYDNARRSTSGESSYFMEEDEVVRAYKPHPTYIFSVTKEGIDGTAVEGEYLVSGAGNKLVPSATVPATGFAGKVVRFDPVGGRMSLNVTQKASDYVVIDTVQN